MKTIYYLYHIPGKKIGVTRDLNKRVTVTQGYKPDEYEVLDSSDDINYISDLEIELQKSYGYKVDRQKYNNLTNHKSNEMKLNVTEQTTTFPVSKIHLFKELLDNRDLEWETSLGSFKLSLEAIHWITANSHKSMYNDKRSYIYNKAFHEAFNDIEHTPKDIKISSKYELIREWARNRGIYDEGDSKTQYVKLMEEAGELAQAILKRDTPEIQDAIGDMVVVLTNLAELEDLKIEDCIDSAYDIISKRKGNMVNGTFVKSGEIHVHQTQNGSHKFMKL
jgi:NTP pyrophosphatase (non-canonical NTP hydrolase)